MNHCEFKAHNAMSHGAGVVYVNRREFKHLMQCGMVHEPSYCVTCGVCESLRVQALDAMCRGACTRLVVSEVVYVNHCEFKHPMQCVMVHAPIVVHQGWCM